MHGDQFVNPRLLCEVVDVPLHEIACPGRGVVSHMYDLLALWRGDDVIGLLVGQRTRGMQKAGDPTPLDRKELTLSVLIGF